VAKRKSQATGLYGASRASALRDFRYWAKKRADGADELVALVSVEAKKDKTLDAITSHWGPPSQRESIKNHAKTDTGTHRSNDSGGD